MADKWYKTTEDNPNLTAYWSRNTIADDDEGYVDVGECTNCWYNFEAYEHCISNLKRCPRCNALMSNFTGKGD